VRLCGAPVELLVLVRTLASDPTRGSRDELLRHDLGLSHAGQ
jgi:hypothetical protein